jgi:hypothetical protein
MNTVKAPKPSAVSSKDAAVLHSKDADALHEELKPKDAPTPKASRGLGAKEEQMNEKQLSNEKGSDSPGG